MIRDKCEDERKTVWKKVFNKYIFFNKSYESNLFLPLTADVINSNPTGCFTLVVRIAQT